MATIEKRTRNRLYYGWVIVGVTFLTLLTAAGIRSTPGVLIVPLEREFGWTRAAISVAVSINLLLYGFSGPFAATLMDRFGVRRVMVGSLTLVAAGVGLTTLMHAAWQLDLLWGVVVGLGTGTTALVLGAYVANRWFVARRGVVMGILTASTATGQLLFLPFLASLVVSHGWRAAALTVTGAAVLIMPLGLIGTHLIPASMDHGLPEVTAAGLLAAMGVFDLVGTTVSGWLSDRWDSRYLLCWYYGLRGLSLLFLPYAFGTQFLGLAAFAVFYGLDWVATVPPTVRLTADIFGRRNAGVMFGWIAAGHQVGAATAALGAGALRTWLGSYQISFMGAGLLCLIAAGLVIRIGRAARGAPLPSLPVELPARI